MVVVTKNISISTAGENEIINITEKIQSKIDESEIENGIVTVFVSASTAALTTIEYESGLLKDFPRMLSRIAPDSVEYEHEKMWHDGNGRSHVKSSLIGPSLTIPFQKGIMLLGTWQQIVLIELDTKKRERDLILQILGE